MPALENPYASLPAAKWLRGNLHAHTTRSDGERHPQAVIDDYAVQGYDFLMLSDHDIFWSPDMLAELNPRNLTLLPGNEITAHGPHMLHVFADRRLDPTPNRQIVLDQLPTSRGFILACHPNWEDHFDHCPLASLRQWTGYTGLEIYNGVIGRLTGSSYALDKWDLLLSAGRRLWGFANDDSHAAAGDTALGWNMVLAPDRTPQAIAHALTAGSFYASTGVTITDLQVTGRHIALHTENAQRIVAHQQFGQRFATVDASSIEVDVPPNAAYARFTCWGPGEQFAWTQPFFSVK